MQKINLTPIELNELVMYDKLTSRKNFIIPSGNNKVAFKVTRGYQSAKTRRTDYIFMEELFKKQEKIKLTHLPMGVLLCEYKCVGQIIPFFSEYETLKTVVFEDLKQLLLIQSLIIDKMEELFSNGVGYCDIHQKNFVVSKNLDVQIIDFELGYVFLQTPNLHYNLAIERLVELFNLMMFKRKNEIVQNKVHFSSFEEARLILKNN